MDCDDEKAYVLQGYATTYEFWDNKSKCNTRISQFLILPIYQKQGLGKDLLAVRLRNNSIGNIQRSTKRQELLYNNR